MSKAGSGEGNTLNEKESQERNKRGGLVRGVEMMTVQLHLW